jgi:hypothetical protein
MAVVVVVGIAYHLGQEDSKPAVVADHSLAGNSAAAVGTTVVDNQAAAANNNPETTFRAIQVKKLADM